MRACGGQRSHLPLKRPTPCRHVPRDLTRYIDVIVASIAIGGAGPLPSNVARPAWASRPNQSHDAPRRRRAGRSVGSLAVGLRLLIGQSHPARNESGCVQRRGICIRSSLSGIADVFVESAVPDRSLHNNLRVGLSHHERVMGRIAVSLSDAQSLECGLRCSVRVRDGHTICAAGNLFVLSAGFGQHLLGRSQRLISSIQLHNSSLQCAVLGTVRPVVLDLTNIA